MSYLTGLRTDWRKNLYEQPVVSNPWRPHYYSHVFTNKPLKHLTDTAQDKLLEQRFQIILLREKKRLHTTPRIRTHDNLNTSQTLLRISHWNSQQHHVKEDGIFFVHTSTVLWACAPYVRAQKQKHHHCYSTGSQTALHYSKQAWQSSTALQ